MSPDNGEKGKPKVIPNEWFKGIGNNAMGIVVVFPSEIFAGLEGGEVGIKMNEWSHLHNNNLPDDVEHRKKITQRIEDATRFIEKQTGFSAEEIDAECRRLAKQYKGTKKAPFSVVLGP